jgi:hypothetical protein
VADKPNEQAATRGSVHRCRDSNGTCTGVHACGRVRVRFDDNASLSHCLLEPEKVGFGSVTSGDGPIVDPNAGRLQFRRCFV